MSRSNGDATALPNHNENNTEILFCMTCALKSNKHFPYMFNAIENKPVSLATQFCCNWRIPLLRNSEYINKTRNSRYLFETQLSQQNLVSAFYLPFVLAQIYLQLHSLPPTIKGAKTSHPVNDRRMTYCVTIEVMFERPSNLLGSVQWQLVCCYVG
jgi:hypothetical protein